jgi:hypothetical protein
MNTYRLYGGSFRKELLDGVVRWAHIGCIGAREKDCQMSAYSLYEGLEKTIRRPHIYYINILDNSISTV